MQREHRLTVGIWLLTTALVAGGALLAYHLATRVPALAGRTDPSRLYADPSLLFTDPGLLGTAVEMRVTEAVRDCMKEAGFDYRGPAVIEGFDDLLDPGADGYGIAAGPQVAPPRLGVGGGDGGTYEAALYGSSLADATGAEAGCVAVGRAALDSALASLAALPYSIEQLEADALAHPAYVEALGEWRACMTGRGHQASSPDELVADQAAALAAATSAEEAAALADDERQLAAADFACREGTIDAALPRVAADLAPAFVQRNREQLEALIPPPGQPEATTEGLGTGDVQVTLRWSSAVDLDLAVADPAGDLVSYSNRAVASGGQLDRDANYPCNTATTSPVENVYWPPAGAPGGAYRVTVTYRTGCATEGPQGYELTIRLDGVVADRVEGTIEPGESLVREFTYEAP